MRYSTQTVNLIRRCAVLARGMGHSYVGSVHLLLALEELPGGTGQLLRLLGMEWESTQAMVMLLYGLGDPELPLPQGFTRAARRILRAARREARRQGKRAIEPGHILLALAREPDCAAGELLCRHRIVHVNLVGKVHQHQIPRCLVNLRRRR